MASNSQHTSLDIEALSTFVTAINERNHVITSVTWGRSTASDCLPICINAYEITMQRPAKSPMNLGKIILGLTFQAILVLFVGSPSSSHPISMVLFQAAMLISFAVAFTGIFLQNAYPRIAVLFEKMGALFAAFGVCIMAGLLIHHGFSWICWLVCALSLLAFIISFSTISSTQPVPSPDKEEGSVIRLLDLELGLKPEAEISQVSIISNKDGSIKEAGFYL